MWKSILKTTFLAGTLDISAAFVQAYVMNKALPKTVLQYIASGFFGDKAFDGGLLMAFCGLIFHFIITFACVAIFFAIYPKLKFLHHKVFFNALMIALLAWIITQKLIIPLSRIEASSIEWKQVVLQIAILFFCIGIPISSAARKLFFQKQ